MKDLVFVVLSPQLSHKGTYHCSSRKQIHAPAITSLKKKKYLKLQFALVALISHFQSSGIDSASGRHSRESSLFPLSFLGRKWREEGVAPMSRDQGQTAGTWDFLALLSEMRNWAVLLRNPEWSFP